MKVKVLKNLLENLPDEQEFTFGLFSQTDYQFYLLEPTAQFRNDPPGTMSLIRNNHIFPAKTMAELARKDEPVTSDDAEFPVPYELQLVPNPLKVFHLVPSPEYSFIYHRIILQCGRELGKESDENQSWELLVKEEVKDGRVICTFQQTVNASLLKKIEVTEEELLNQCIDLIQNSDEEEEDN